MPRHFSRRSILLSRWILFPLYVCALALMPCLGHARADDAQIRSRGEKIYQASCLKCHGKAGMGTEDHYPDPLLGDATVGELTRLIAETMPEQKPESCVGPDAAAVAAYMHHSFYSEAAQLRNRPPRVRLARLTGEQLRQSLSGLYSGMDQSPWIESKRGVEAIYFNDDKWNNKKKSIERQDAVIDFDFGNNGPGGGVNAKEFYIHWSGSILVPHSGRYEIIVRSTCAFTMDFGRDGRELFNNHVQSEGRTEFRKTLQLTGGQAYMFKIDFFQRKRKTKQPPAKISLSWVPPGGAEHVIPQQFLIPSWFPPNIALQAKLPPDDRSYGYERGTAVNRQWDESTTRAALEFSQYASGELWVNYRKRHRKDSNENRKQLRDFLSEIVERAFRGPVEDDQRKLYIDDQIKDLPDDAQAIRKVCLIVLKSPRFLYPMLDSDRTPSQRAANRLSLILHDSLPSDKWLRQAALKNQMAKNAQLVNASYRMLDDYRAHAKMRAFLYEFFDLAHAEDINKDQEKFPGFDKTLISDLRRSFDMTIDAIVWSEDSDYRKLFTVDWVMTNDRLSKFYGKTWRPAKPIKNDKAGLMVRSRGDSKTRIGVLSHPLLMAELAYHANTSPIHRGVFLYRKAFGRPLRPPNAAFSPLNPDLHPKLTTRERVEMQTAEKNCQVCHGKINSLGFALENFDPVGRYRFKENNQKVLATGAYTNRAGETVQFDGPRELAKLLTSSDDAHRAFVDSCFEYFVKQPINAYGANTLDRLTKQFREQDFDMRQLLVSIAVTVATHDLQQN